ncbi:MAG: DUF1295 domain-containing protein [Deltaproteobacteria bacterium]|nr:DUF1295 domain-containing protein [Deltaproteobacteria bacterium]
MFEIVYAWLFWALVAVSVIVFIALLFVTAPYGKFGRTGWGPALNSTLAWVLMESAAVFTMPVMFLLSDRTGNAVSIAFLLLWESHYVYRTFIFPFRRTGHPRPMPVSVMGMALFFNVWNGFLNGAALFHLGPESGREIVESWMFWAGTGLFFCGMAINHQSDNILRRLRKDGQSGYRIPEGGLYRWVSMPAYLGEIIEWTGFALLTCSSAAVLFACFTAANLVPRAISSHKWYLQTFREYPQKRKAIIPFIL